MQDKATAISRRSFIKTAGAAGLGSAMAPLSAVIGPGRHPGPRRRRVPTRSFGRSGIEVPILSLGGMFDIPSNQTMLKQAIRWGVTYWDTAHVYSGGRSEEGIGQYFKPIPSTGRKSSWSPNPPPAAKGE
jgi:hypothetical protein